MRWRILLPECAAVRAVSAASLLAPDRGYESDWDPNVLLGPLTREVAMGVELRPVVWR